MEKVDDVPKVDIVEIVDNIPLKSTLYTVVQLQDRGWGHMITHTHTSTHMAAAHIIPIQVHPHNHRHFCQDDHAEDHRVL